MRRIVAALGGELEVVAKFPKGSVKINQFETSPRRHGRHAPAELQLV
jgi:hypothetical protein